MANPPRLLAIGMDAFPPALLEEWCASGDLPNMAILLQNGRYTRVDSVAGIFPGSVWPTFSATADPSFHGIHHFMHWDPARMTFRRPAPDWCDYTPFWRRPMEERPPMIIFDLPFSFPQREPVPGLVEVHGWGLHDELAPPFSQPRPLLGELRRRHGRSAMRPDVLGPKPVELLLRELEGVVDSVQRRAAAIEDLARQFPWRFFLAPFAETHRAGHWYWTERSTGVSREGLKRVAVAIDAVLPRLRALVGPDDHFALFSLHGMGDLYDLDRFSEPVMDYLEPPSTRSFDPVRILNRALPGGLRRTLSAALSTRMRDRLLGHYMATGHDWSKTRLVGHPSDGNLYLRLNLQGRERDGVVAAADGGAILVGAAESALAMHDLDGNPVLREAVLTSTLYGDGSRRYLLPDLILRPSGRVPDTIVMEDGTRLHVPWRGWRDGDHRPEGFCIQAGPGIAAGTTAPALPQQELAYYLGEPADLNFPR